MLIIAIYEVDSAHESSMFEAKSLRGQNSHSKLNSWVGLIFVDSNADLFMY